MTVQLLLSLHRVGGQRLEPLEGREADIHFTQPHDKHRKKIPQSSKTQYKSEQLISVPDTGFKQTIPPVKHGIIGAAQDTMDAGRFALKTTQERECRHSPCLVNIAWLFVCILYYSGCFLVILKYTFKFVFFSSPYISMCVVLLAVRYFIAFQYGTKQLDVIRFYLNAVI